MVFSIKQNLGPSLGKTICGLLSSRLVLGGRVPVSGHRYCLRVAPSVMDTFSAVETVKQQLMMHKTQIVRTFKAMPWHSYSRRFEQRVCRTGNKQLEQKLRNV